MGYFSDLTFSEETIERSPEGVDTDVESAERRLRILEQLNASFAAEEGDLQRRSSKAALADPVSIEQTYSVFGLTLGLIPPASFFARLLLDGGRMNPGWAFLVLAALVILGASVTGYFTGRIVGKAISEVERLSWVEMLIALPFIGVTWGIAAGAAGGIFVFLFGAILGAVIGAGVGAFALTIFTIFHRLLKSGDNIERRHLYPLAVGISGITASIILGFPGF